MRGWLSFENGFSYEIRPGLPVIRAQSWRANGNPQTSLGLFSQHQPLLSAKINTMFVRPILLLLLVLIAFVLLRRAFRR
jgi:hypothetical protein